MTRNLIAYAQAPLKYARRLRHVHVSLQYGLG